MIAAREIAREGVSWAAIRRYGRQLFPQGVAWQDLDRRSEVPAEAALCICAVYHLTERRVLTEAEALSALAFHCESVTRYARTVEKSLLPFLDGEAELADLALPAAMLEILDGRWVRFGRGQLFDVEKQQALDFHALATPEHWWKHLWSHCLSLLQLLVRLYPLEERDHDAEHDA